MSIRSEAVGTSEIRPEGLEQHRSALTGYCYRMLGSVFDADDAVQETMLRAWRSADGFEGRSAARSWLYRIATNVCLDMLRGRQRRARPMDLGPSSTAETTIGPMLPEYNWVQPIPDGRVLPDGDPAELAAQRDTIRLAFVAALQHLPARQRAVLILREVLRWQAAEVADLLDASAASVNSALQRARATLAARDVASTRPEPVAAGQQELLARYVDAFQRYDITALVSLLHEDAVMSMPPYNFWLRGPANMGRWFLGQGAGCRDSRLVATAANGCAAFGFYHMDPGGGHAAWAIQVIEVAGGKITGHHNFVDPDLFAVFGLPGHLDP